MTRQWLAQISRVAMHALALAAIGLVLFITARPVLADDAPAVQPAPRPPILVAARTSSQPAAVPQQRLTPELLAAYVSRQQALKNFSFDLPTQHRRLTSAVLSAYVARRANPALAAIYSLDTETPDDSTISAATLEAYATSRFVPTAKRVQHASKEELCLAQAIYNEARGEPVSGQWAVANVVINRALSKRFPSTLCGVVFQDARAGSRHCQFSFACDGRPDTGTNRVAWHRATRIALAAFREFQRGQRPNVLPKSALFYHAKSVNPRWANVFREVASIGDHIFYSPM